MVHPGVDFNLGVSYPALAADGKKFAIRYLREDAPEYRLTRGEAELAAFYGVMLGAVWQEGHAESIWEGRQGAKPGYETGRQVAEIAREQLRPIAGRGDRPILFAVDWPVTNDGHGNTRRIAPALDFLRGCASVISRQRTGVYGSGFMCKRAKRDIGIGHYWLSHLLEGVYDGGTITLRSEVPFVTLLQFGNADRDPTLQRYGADPGTPRYSYVGHDRAWPGAPLWWPE